VFVCQSKWNRHGKSRMNQDNARRNGPECLGSMGNCLFSTERRSIAKIVASQNFNLPGNRGTYAKLSSRPVGRPLRMIWHGSNGIMIRPFARIVAASTLRSSHLCAPLRPLRFGW